MLFIAEAGDGRTVRAAVKGDMDPGYGSTAKMLGEAGRLPGPRRHPHRHARRLLDPGLGDGRGADRAASNANAGLTFTLEN